jgi:DNA-binding LytR/AlgR family response regulator
MVDDERIYFMVMKDLFTEFETTCDCHIEAETFSSGSEFFEAFYPGAYDLIFLDIYIGKTNGVDIAKQIRASDQDCLLVFLTGSGEFMPEAFACHAFDYITKPISSSHVFQVLSDAMAKLAPKEDFVEVANGRRKVPVLLRDILAVVTDLHYLKISLIDGTSLRCRMTITDFLDLVRHDPRFILVNKGILLNADHITGFDENCCVMEGKEMYPIRVRDRSQIQQTIQDYNIQSMQRHHMHASNMHT